jgi:hypothetical protein
VVNKLSLSKKSKTRLFGLSLLEVVVATSVLFTGASASMGLFALGCRVPEKAEEAANITRHCQRKLEAVLAKVDEDLRPLPPSFDPNRSIVASNYNEAYHSLTEDPNYQVEVKGEAGTGSLNGMAIFRVAVRSNDGRAFKLTGMRRSRNMAPMLPPPPPPADFRGGTPPDIAELTRGSQIVQEAGCLTCHGGAYAWTWSSIQLRANGNGDPTLQHYPGAPMTPEDYIIRVVTMGDGPQGDVMGVQVNPANTADAHAVAAYVSMAAQGQNPELFITANTPLSGP